MNNSNNATVDYQGLTMKGIRARAILEHINDVLYKEWLKLDNLMKEFLDGKCTAALARRVYRTSMERATWYSGIGTAIANKYSLRLNTKLNQFENFIKFFEL